MRDKISILQSPNIGALNFNCPVRIGKRRMRVHILFFILFGLNIFQYSYAQTDTAWVSTYGGIQNDVCNQIKPTYDGGYITIGTTNSFCGGNSLFYIIKTDSLCKKEWSKAIGGPGIQGGYSVATTFDHGYAFVGFTNSYGNGNYNTLLVKTDSDGNLKWEKVYSGTDWNFGYSIAQTIDSGFVICGLTYSYPAVNGDVYVIRTDKNGDTLWTRTIGGNGYDVGNSVCVHSKKLYAIVGSTTSFGSGDTSIYVILLNANGSILKDTAYCPGGTYNYNASSIEPTADNGYLIFGYTDSLKTPGIPNQILYKTDSLATIPKVGNYWYYMYPNPKIAYGKDAVQAADGNIITVGSTTGYGMGGINMDMQYVYSSGGWFIGGAAFGGSNSNYGSSVAINKNGNVVFAGSTNSFGQGLLDVYLVRVKTDSIVTNYFLVNKFKPDSNCNCPLSVPSSSIIEPSVKIFPNPMTLEATILVIGTVPKNYYFNLYDVAGNCVMRGIALNASSHDQSVGHINRGNLPSGTYFYEILDREKRIATGKIAIE